jgi:TPR repeat protein
VGWFCESSAATLSQPAGCACCGRDLTHLQIGARFCPDCGCKIPIAKHRPIAIVRQILPLIHFGRGNVQGGPASPGRTAILIGYANALYHLGWRYERGSGTPKNLPEAKRCYKKSARLGNLDAVMRLSPSESETPVPVVPITR